MYHKTTNPFYLTPAWRRLRIEVLQEQRHECQMCRQQGYYTRANTVHHVNYVEHYPELALEKYYIDKDGNKQRNLLAVCVECHRIIHETAEAETKPPLTVERW